MIESDLAIPEAQDGAAAPGAVDLTIRRAEALPADEPWSPKTRLSCDDSPMVRW